MAKQSGQSTPNATARTAPDEWGDVDDLRQRIEALQDDISQADRRLRAAVRGRPFLAIGAAVLTGFLLGRVMTRA